MHKSKSYNGLAMLVAGLLSLPAWAADHREAARIQEDPSADINDVYIFHSPTDASKLVLVMTVNPFSVPGQSPNYNFSPNVRYRFNIDNTGDAIADHTVDVIFTPVVPGPQEFTAVFSPGNIQVTGRATRSTVQPQPNDPIVVEGPNGIRLFAGPRDDPFFFDLVGFNRFLAGTGTFTGDDTFAGFNVSVIVVELPESMVRNGDTVLQFWGQTDRPRQTVRKDFTTGEVERQVLPFEQIERMGAPVVSTVFIPSSQKDLFNVRPPNRDQDFADEIIARATALGTSQQNIDIILSVVVPDTLKLDLSQPDGFPNGRRLQDDVIDALLTLVLNQPSTDLVDANDKPFSDTFPYLAAPHQP